MGSEMCIRDRINAIFDKTRYQIAIFNVKKSALLFFLFDPFSSVSFGSHDPLGTEENGSFLVQKGQVCLHQSHLR